MLLYEHTTQDFHKWHMYITRSCCWKLVSHWHCVESCPYSGTRFSLMHIARWEEGSCIAQCIYLYSENSQTHSLQSLYLYKHYILQYMRRAPQFNGDFIQQLQQINFADTAIPYGRRGLHSTAVRAMWNTDFVLPAKILPFIQMVIFHLRLIHG